MLCILQIIDFDYSKYKKLTVLNDSAKAVKSAVDGVS